MSKINATITVEKSFDEGKEYRKCWETGDLHEFLSDEGEYLDKLCHIVAEKGDVGEGFTVTYTVKVVKEE